MKILEEFLELSSKITNTPITLREEDFIDVNKNPIIDHIKRYPRLEWQDVYKFVFQGSCGWTHLSTNSSEEKVVQHLNNELTLASKPLPDEQLFESLNNSTNICRINLRVWKKEKLGKLHELWKLMVNVEKTIPKTTDIFRKEWLNLMDLINRDYIVISDKRKYLVEEWIRIVLKFSEEIEQSSIMPLLHHSETYRNLYKPSYRLVNKNDLHSFLATRKNKI